MSFSFSQCNLQCTVFACRKRIIPIRFHREIHIGKPCAGTVCIAVFVQYLSGKIFGGETGTVMEPDPADVAGFDAYIENYKKALEAEMAAVETMPIL